ncbi:MAG: fructosamine kinase family protein, partial [Rhodothermales bacterium]|nr:fructosamine kinase family protein [Rhodothermales bacterium]
MSLPPSVEAAVRECVGAVRAVEAVAGGCIAHASRVRAGGGSFFLTGAEGAAGATFVAEAAGLRALRTANSPLLIPNVLAVRDAEAQRPGFLL